MARKNQIFRVTLAVAAAATGVQALANGLARTPQMGWDNWNALGCTVSEDLLIDTAKLIVSYGLSSVGYYYVVLDDCWSAGRNASANNVLIHDATRFPRGMAAVADDIHALGLGFGMYSDAGKYTCAGYEGSLGFEEVDANTWASWGIDYLKYDNCFNMGNAGTQQISAQRYEAMSKALNATSRLILYSLCNWGEDSPWNWGSTIANSWRITGDISDVFDKRDDRCPCDGTNAYDCNLPGFHCSIMNIMNKASFVVHKSQPGGWNDLDMLEVGNGAMSDVEYVAHFSVWSALKSPLIMGNDIRTMTPSSLTILNNPAVIAVNQDPRGASASRRWVHPFEPSTTTDTFQLWSGPLMSTTDQGVQDQMVLLFNGGINASLMSASLTDIFADEGAAGTAPQVRIAWEVRDLWVGRMKSEDAQLILDGDRTPLVGNGTFGSSMWYNATELSYADGLKARDKRLLGTVVGRVEPLGNLSASVEAHGVKMFRLRALGGLGQKMDEL